MRLSVVTSAIVAALVGIAGALAVVLAAAEAVKATPGQTTSWVTALAISMALTSGYLSLRHRIPVITAWSTPGAAVIAATGGAMTIETAVGAFLLAGGLIVLTAAFRPLSAWIERIPVPIAAAMLAGVLVRFVTGMFEVLPGAPQLVLPLIAVFLVVRMASPSAAMIAVIAAAVAIAYHSGDLAGLEKTLSVSHLEIVVPHFEIGALIGLGVPLFLVTMASQNLPGAAVLRANGYPVPMGSVLAVTGLASVLTAPLGAHTTNLAAITAAICTGPDAHPDPTKRWTTGIAYCFVYGGLAVLGASLVALFQAFPGALIKTVAGLGLIGSLTGALGSALDTATYRFAAVATFCVTVSGMTLFGIGSAFWGLVAGIVLVGFEQVAAAVRR
jgi:benzoate membrane transport protein